VDNIINEYGHQVLRNAPYHCQFNAIEEIWGLCKQYYDRHMGSDGYGDEQVLKMWDESLRQVTPEIWLKVIRRTENVIKKWWEREKVIDESMIVHPIIINPGEDDSEEEEEDEEEEKEEEN